MHLPLAFTVDSLFLARTQFGATTLYHFIFVPVTIGLAFSVAVMQTIWHRTGDEAWLRATKFWGKLMLISFALGVVTGIVQEFQFGMNWSQYTRFVGDIFGAPLAMEGLAAFFVESTFLGLWIFGWNRLSPRVHLATAWLVSLSTMLSAFFIIAANSWMQHPVGYVISPVTKRPELDDIGTVLANPIALLGFSHVIMAAGATAGAILLAVSAYHLRRGTDLEVARRVLKLGMPLALIGIAGTLAIGHFQGIVLEEDQPMKMAAADAIFTTQKNAGLSLFATGDFKRNPEGLNRNIEIPGLLSLITGGSTDTEIKGVNDINREYQAKYGPGDYAPNVGITYWSWRAMIGPGVLLFLIVAVAAVLSRRRRLEGSRFWLGALVAAGLLPFVSNLAGWGITEFGRQPWIVVGLLRTQNGVSPLVGQTAVTVTLIGFVLVYLILGVIGVRLFLRYAKIGPDETVPEPKSTDDRPDLALAY